MAGTAVEQNNQTIEEYDEYLATHPDFLKDVTNAESSPDARRAISEKWLDDITRAEDTAELLKNGPEDKRARNSIRSAFVRFLQGILKRFLKPPTGESGGVIDVGDLSKDGIKGKREFFQRIYDLHVQDYLLDKNLLKFIKKVASKDYKIEITPEGQTDAGFTAFETDLKKLPTLSQIFFVDRVLKSSEVSNALGLTNPEVQLNRLVPEDKNIENQPGPATNSTSIEALNKIVETQDRILKNQEQLDQSRRQSQQEGGLSRTEIENLERLKNSWRSNFNLDTQPAQGDSVGWGEYTERLHSYNKMLDYVNMGEERAATAHGKTKENFENEINKTLQKLNYTGGVKSLPGYNEAVEYSNRNKGAGFDRQNLDPTTSQKLRELSYQDLAGQLIDEGKGWSDDAEEIVSQRIDELVYLFFEKVDTLPNVEYKELYSEYNQGHAFNYIVNYFYGAPDEKTFAAQIEKIKDPHTKELAREKSRRFFKEKTLQKVLKKRTNTELYHNLFRSLAKNPIDKWADFMLNIDLAELASEVDDEITPYAIETWDKLVRKYITKDGFIPPEMFETQYNPELKMDVLKIQEDFVKELGMTLKGNGMILEGKEWRLREAFSKSKALSAMLMKTTAQLSQANVTEGFAKTPIYDKAKMHGGPEQEYGGGLGGRDLIKMANLQTIRISQQHFTPGEEGAQHSKHYDALRSKDLQHNPKKIDMAGEAFRKFDENLITEEEFKKFLQTLEVYEQDPDNNNTLYHKRKKFALPDVLGQGGWGLAGIEKAYDQYLVVMKEKFKADTQLQERKNWRHATWKQKYEYFQSVMGARAEFLYAQDRADDEIDDMFSYDNYQRLKFAENSRARDVMIQEDFAKDKKHHHIHLHAQVFTGKMDEYGKPIYRSEGIDDAKYKELRHYTHKGEAFYHLLQNDPESFLNAMYKMMDQSRDNASKYVIIDPIREGTLKLKRPLREGTSAITEMDASKFYFIKQDRADKQSLFNQLDKADQDKIVKFQYYINTHFRVDKNPENGENIKFIMDFHKKLNARYDNKEVAREQLHKYLLIAHNRALQRMQKKESLAGAAGFLKPEDFIIDPEIFKDGKDGINPQEAEFIKDLVLGGGAEKGLIPYFKEVVGDEAYTFGYEDKNNDGKRDGEYIGNIDGFFHRWGTSWYNIDCIVTDPDAYFNLKDFLPHANAAGPEMLGRRVGQYKPFAELRYNNFVKFYSALKKATLEAAHGGPIDLFKAFSVKGGVIDILKSFKDMDEYIGSKPGYREFTEMMTIVALTYIQQDGRIERPYVVSMPIGFRGISIPIPFLSMPPFLRPLIKGALGTESSLSRLSFKGEKRSYEATMDEMRAIIHYLEDDGVFDEEIGERIIEQLHISHWFMIWYRFIPDLMWFILTAIGATATEGGVKEFIAESGGGGGGGGKGGGHH